MEISFAVLLIFISIAILHVCIIYFIFPIQQKKHLENQPATAPTKWPSLAILVCARDEASHVKKFIPKLCTLPYPDLRVYVVNHQSIDLTQHELNQLENEFENLTTIDCLEDDPALPGKRTAIAAGLLQIKAEYILLTDADCTPRNEEWPIRMMDVVKQTGAGIVLGISPYAKASGLLNQVIQFETFHTAMLYTAAAQAGRPYMAVGRNMLIKRSLLEDNLKRSVIPGIVSGDDDLLINAVAHTANIQIETDSRTHVTTLPKTNWNDYFQQKSRHASTAAFYRDSHKFILILLYGTQAGLYLLFLLTLFTPYIWIALLVFSLRYFILSGIYHHRKNQLELKLNVIKFPIFEIILSLVSLKSVFSGTKKDQW